MKDVVSSTLLGNADFISYIKETFLSDKKPDKDLPALKELAPKASMQYIFDAVDKSLGNDARFGRNVKMYLCQKYTAEKLKDKCCTRSTDNTTCGIASLGTGTEQLSQVGAWIWVKFVRSQITKVDGIASYFDAFGI